MLLNTTVSTVTRKLRVERNCFNLTSEINKKHSNAIIFNFEIVHTPYPPFRREKNQRCLLSSVLLNIALEVLASSKNKNEWERYTMYIDFNCKLFILLK